MTFSLETKIELSLLQIKKQCCRRAFISGILLGGADVSGNDISLYLEGDDLSEIACKLIKEQFGRDVLPIKTGKRGIRLISFSSKSAAEFLNGIGLDYPLEKIIKCEECFKSFLRGLFIGGGTVSEPLKRNYHLELKSRSKENLSFLISHLEDEGLDFKLSTRLDRQTSYIKDSDNIQEFLFYLGSSKQAFAFMNAKIGHEFKNAVNRRTNCETGNIARSTASAAKHLSAIRFLIDRGRLSELGPDLEYTAKCRLENPEMSLVQLGQVMTPAVSKPGLYHRLEKICAFAENIKSKEQ